MTGVLLLIYVPILLFVLAFLYETYLSFARLFNKKKGRGGYVEVTWEVTHTLLVFGVVMMLMLYTGVIDKISDVIFLPAFLAAVALGVRGICYIYVFYISNEKRRTWVDWLFAISHVVAALLLVVVVGLYTWFLYTTQPVANTQFVAPFTVGLIVILAVTALPLSYLYLGRHGK
ncbi:MAG: hypothetical protein QG549_677 [Patescibacteria group bacterium]|nr:hypothetical protein [Patescibacteria group bacterium]